MQYVRFIARSKAPFIRRSVHSSIHRSGTRFIARFIVGFIAQCVVRFVAQFVAWFIARFGFTVLIHKLVTCMPALSSFAPAFWGDKANHALEYK